MIINAFAINYHFPVNLSVRVCYWQTAALVEVINLCPSSHFVLISHFNCRGSAKMDSSKHIIIIHATHTTLPISCTDECVLKLLAEDSCVKDKSTTLLHSVTFELNALSLNNALNKTHTETGLKAKRLCATTQR